MRGKVMERKRVHVKKGDQVRVIKGNDVDKTGKVLEVIPKTGRVVVDGVNIVKRHTRPNPSNPQGGVIESPGSISAANVMLVCPRCNKPTRVGKSREEGQSAVRMCKRCGKSID